jgi:putative SOS response-associated peptidase YedK
VRAVHDRMTAILARDDCAKWPREVPATSEELRTL